ncbi:hypothetical protein AB0M11_23300 [Streptomyces sp. NPDC051987]|uniref:hypothetical protein n=1 Tax=Streptomyces sp. NPDC051987 TaxID=3155808 RepID=UPI003426747A
MQESQGAAVPPEGVRYRSTLGQRLLPVIPAGVALAFQLLLWWDGGSIDPLIGSGLVIWGVLVPLSVLTSRSFGVTLTPTAAVVHNFRRRTIPWSDVQAVQMESYAGSRIVVLYEAGGRATRLRAPSTGFLSWDRGFEEKFHTIGRWWLDHRGPDWTPVPPPWMVAGGPSAPPGDPFAPPA